jgi:predicted MPP superfamily phosphohydrolase
MHLKYLFLLSLIALDAMGLPFLPDSGQPFSFVVLGDMHYKRPDFSSQKIASAIAASVKDREPPIAFVCQTGDIVEGGTYEMKDGKRIFRLANHDETKTELDYALRDVTEKFRRPLFIAVGNHDKHGGGTAFPAAAWPLFTRELGTPVTNNCFGFRYGNSAFVFLDFAPADPLAQQEQIRQLLKQAQAQGGLQHIFLFAHYPLWPLIRPGFSSAKLTESLLPIFKEFPVDAYFCGHTHNSAAWVHKLDGATITQLQGVACEAIPSLTPMEECRTLLLPQEELSYYWGYTSGPKHSFFIVTVEADRVRVQWRTDTQLLREFAWRQPGQLTDLTQPPKPAKVPVTEAALKDATAATLAFCPWAEDGCEVIIRLNGETLTTTPLGPTMRSNAFVNEKRVAIPADKLHLLRLANTLTFENPDRAIFGLGHIYLEVQLADGRTARTPIATRFLFSASAEEGRAAKLKYGWDIIPAAAIQSVPLGQPLGPLELHWASAAP